MNMSSSSSMHVQPQLDRRFSVCDRFMMGHRPEDLYEQSFRYGSSEDEEAESPPPPPPPYPYNDDECSLVREERDKSKYCLVASKQMVGIFLSVWVKSDLRDSVKNLKVSCVGRGLMGYLGNKVLYSFFFFFSYSSF